METRIPVQEEFGMLAGQAVLNRTVAALEGNGIRVLTAETGEEARSIVRGMLPKGARVMNMTSMTLQDTGIADDINVSGNYDSVRNRLNSMDHETHDAEMRALGCAPQWSVGSVHAVTQDGQVIIASKTGSQLPAYAYGAQHVIWVVSTKKIVADLEEGFRRVREYSWPREDQRALQAYGNPSAINKQLIISREEEPDRITLIFVQEDLGF